MIKVLIADDEIMIHVMLSKLINWESYGFEIVGFAEDGISALKKIETEEIDLVVADIRMPGLDGIGLIKELRERGFKTKVVFISGHRQFEYAKSGMKYEVDDYILKPIKKDELIGTLNRLKSKIDAEIKGQTESKEKENQLIDGKKTLQSNLIKMLILGKINKKELLALEEINKHYLCKFKSGFFMFAVFHVDVEKTAKNTKPNLDIVDTCVKSFVDVANVHCYYVITYTENNTVTLLLNFDNSKEEALKEDLVRAYQNNSTITEKFWDINFTLGMGEGAQTLANAKDSYMQAFECVCARIQLGKNKIIQYKDLLHKDINEETLFPVEKQKQLETVIAEINYEGFVHITKEIFSLGGNSTLYTYYELWWVIKKYTEILLKGLKELLPNKEEAKYDISKLYDYTEMAMLKEGAIEEGIKCYGDAIKTIVVENPFIAASKNYIKKNYRNKITLKDVANIIHLNPVYLSILFKKETGQRFVDYLMTYRVEQSKMYLDNNKYSIAQISEMVGYGDSRHFSRKFRQITGYTPTEYRKIYLRIKK